MPHEFRNLSSLSHSQLGLILIGGVVSAVVIVGLILFLNWKHRRRSPDAVRRHRPKPQKVKRRRRR
jgi:hypothetical protein